MANKIILKRSSVQGKIPIASDLDYGELAINYNDGKIYFKKSDNSIDNFSIGAGSGSVTSVSVQSSDLTVTGSPITTSGVISLALNTVGIAKGGTGATTASGARSNLSAAASGANSDITSLTGLTTALSVAQGGTGSTSVSGARTNLGAVNIAGDTMTGALILNADPAVSLGAATKQYVDNIASGLNIHESCRAGTTGNLTATYSNGTNGVGATLTGTGALPQIGGITLSVNDRVLVKNQTSAVQNGVYKVTTTTENWILTRTLDFDGSQENEIMAGDAVYIQEGTGSGTQWVMNTTGTITVGTSVISWVQFGGPGTYSGGTGISIIDGVFSNTGVTSLVAGTNISVSGSTGAVTVGFSGTLPIASGGTGGTTSSDARTNLGAAASGANSDITSLTGLTTALSVAQGGTGQTSFTSGYLKSNGTALSSSSTISGSDITGAVSSATAVSNTGAVTTNSDFYVPFITNNTTTAQSLNTGSGLKYNPSADKLSVGTLNINQGNISTVTYITTNTDANQVVDSVDATLFRTVKYVIQVTSGNLYQTSELLIVHDGATAYYTEFALIATGSNLATFNANYGAGVVNLRVTPTNSVTTIRAIRTCINV